jgi:hypothetical protein
MEIELGGDYWVDASDGVNWTLWHGRTGSAKKKGKRCLGHHPNLTCALERAIRDGLHADPSVVRLADFGHLVAGMVAMLMRGVEVRIERDKNMGNVRRFTKAVQGGCKTDGTVGMTVEAA